MADEIDERMTCNFTSFSTVFQLYQDDQRLIMKGCVYLKVNRKAMIRNQYNRNPHLTLNTKWERMIYTKFDKRP